MKGARVPLLVGVGVAAFLAALVAQLPARHALAWAGPPAGLAAAQVEGSVWAGNATDLAVGELRLAHLRWRLRPLALLGGALEYAVTVSGRGDQLAGRIGRRLSGAWYLEGLQGGLAAGHLDPLLSGARLGGRVVVDVASARLAPGTLALAGRLAWQDAALRAPVAATLGGFVAEIQPAEQGSAGGVRDTGGPLAADARLELAPDGAYRVTGTLTPRADMPPEWRSALELGLGAPDAQGRFRLNLQGRVPLPGAAL